ncbi:MAG: hypothetical protein WBE68_00215, partial [Candidatus Nitrosopolaris sp.]
IINIGNHVEVICMDSKKFGYYLRALLKRDRNKRIISNDSLEKAIETASEKKMSSEVEIFRRR